MTQIFFVVPYNFDSSSTIGAFSTLELAEKAMREWVDKDYQQEVALAQHWHEKLRKGDRYQEKRDKDGALYFENENGYGLLIRSLELDAPCQFDVIEWLAALQ